MSWSRCGATEQVALEMGAAQCHQGVSLGPGFHAFGDHLQVQAVAQRHDGAHDAGAGVVQQQVMHKRLVNLELVQWQAFEHLNLVRLGIGLLGLGLQVGRDGGEQRVLDKYRRGDHFAARRL